MSLNQVAPSPDILFVSFGHETLSYDEVNEDNVNEYLHGCTLKELLKALFIDRKLVITRQYDKYQRLYNATQIAMPRWSENRKNLQIILVFSYPIGSGWGGYGIYIEYANAITPSNFTIDDLMNYTSVAMAEA